MADDHEPLDIAELHARALRLVGKAVGHVTVADLENRTPCADWDLRTLLNHVIAGNFWVRPLVEGKAIADVGDRFDGDLVGKEPVAVYEQSAADAAGAFFAPGAMTAPCAVSYGPVPGSVYCSHRFFDLVIHGWDIAQSVGADYRIPADMVDAVRQVVGGEMEMLRDAGMTAPEVSVPDDADEQTKLLAMFGRSVPTG